MNYRPLILLLGLFAALGSTVHAQVPPEKALSTFTVADGLEISLWASEPLFVNPTCIDIDHKGRVWVCESVNYRHTLHGRPPRRPEGDRILILEDTHGTGTADKVTTFYQSKETLAPLGIAVAKDPVGPGYKVYRLPVARHPPVRRQGRRRQGRRPAEEAAQRLRRLRPRPRRPRHPHRPRQQAVFQRRRPGRARTCKAPTARAASGPATTPTARAGTIWRCDLDGKNLELIAHNFRNEYEPCVDSFGTDLRLRQRRRRQPADAHLLRHARRQLRLPAARSGPEPLARGAARRRAEDPAHLLRLADRHVRLRGDAAAEEVLGPAAAHRRRPAPGALLSPDAGRGQLRRGARGHGDQHRQLVPALATFAWRRTAASSSPTGTIPASAATAWATRRAAASSGSRRRAQGVQGTACRSGEQGRGYWLHWALPALSVRYMAMAKLQRISAGPVLDTLRPALQKQEKSWLRRTSPVAAW